MNKNAMQSILYTMIMFIGALVCCICDVAVSGNLTWSRIVLSSIWIAWTASFPILLFRKKGVLVSMLAIGIFILPFMYVLSVLTKVNAVFSIGAVVAMITLVFLWSMYILYSRLQKRKLLATGITFLLAIPFVFLINFALSKMIGTPVLDLWDASAICILLLTAVAFIIGDWVRK